MITYDTDKYSYERYLIGAFREVEIQRGVYRREGSSERARNLRRAATWKVHYLGKFLDPFYHILRFSPI